MTSRRVVFGAGAAALAVAACVISVPAYTSHAVEAELLAMATKGSAGNDVKLRNLKHEAGLFSSKGVVDLELRSRCSDGDGADEPVIVRVDYTVSHLPRFSSLNRFEWFAAPQGTSGEVFSRLFGANVRLSGKGGVSYRGVIDSGMELPEISVSNSGSVFHVTPSKGSLSVDKAGLQFSWQFDRGTIRGGGNAVELKQIRLDLDLKNRQLGTGNVTFAVDALSATQFSLERLQISSETVESGGKLDSRVTQRIGKLQLPNEALRDLELEATLKGLHVQSVETLTTLFSDTCGFSNMTLDEGSAMRRALRTLLASGFSFGIPKLTGSGQDGGVDGNLMVEIQAAEFGSAISLAKNVKSSGQIIVRGGLLQAEHKQLALASGFVAESAEGLKASYRYADGTLRVNDKSLDGSAVQQALAQLDQEVLAFLEPTVSREGAKPAVPTKPEIALSGAEAPRSGDDGERAVPASPASAPPPLEPAKESGPALAEGAGRADCPGVQACVAQSLQAALREDIETVRRLASQIDAMPKPDPGNRVQGRKLNAQALEALKADDFGGAMALLQSALRENPRDVEVAANLGFVLGKAGRYKDAAAALNQALQLDPRRTSSWGPLAEALALAGQQKEAAAALWIAYQWSGNREKSEAIYLERAEKEAGMRPALAQTYRTVHAWVTEGKRPDFR